MKSYIKVLLILWLSISLFVFVRPLTFAQTQIKWRVLVLHSYHQGYLWTDSIHEGFISTLFREMDSRVHVEYLDVFTNSSSEYFEQLVAMLSEKYADESFDLIAVSDDPALDFLKNHSELFPEVPVVFCGINNIILDDLIGHRPMTGVNESISIRETLTSALTLKPNASVIGVVSGVGATEKKNLDLFKKEVGMAFLDTPIQYFEGLSPETLATELQSLSENDILIYLGYMSLPDGKTFSVEESIRWIINHSDAPVFSYWDFLIPYGVLGGRVVHGQSQGVAMGHLANQILEGYRIEDLPVLMESPNRFVFNNQSLNRYRIDTNQLPDESFIWREGTLNLKEYWNNEMAKALFGYEMFENHGEMMWIVDVQTGRILDANRALYDFYGYSDLVGMNVGEINLLSEEYYKPLIQTAAAKENNRFYFNHLLADGRVIQVNVSSYPIFVGGKEVLFSIIRDVTEELKMAEKVKMQNRIIFIGYEC